MEKDVIDDDDDSRIDAHVESAVEYTTRATNDTKKALEYQSAARKKKCMMLPTRS